MPHEWKGKVVEDNFHGLILENDGKPFTDLENFFYEYRGRRIRITIQEYNVVCSNCGQIGFDGTYPNRDLIEVNDCGYCNKNTKGDE